MAEARGFDSQNESNFLRALPARGGQVCHKLEPSQGGTYSLGQTLNSYQRGKRVIPINLVY